MDRADSANAAGLSPRGGSREAGRRGGRAVRSHRRDLTTPRPRPGSVPTRRRDRSRRRALLRRSASNDRGARKENSMKTSQTEHARDLIASMHALDVRTSELQRAADTAALEWQPPEGGWSAGQVFEHLCVANDSYLVGLRRVLGTVSATSRGDVADRVWRPSFAGRLLARSMDSPRK